MMRRIPRWITAELTYRCPLSCFYCSNPIQMSTKHELTTKEWVSTFSQARKLGCVQLGLTGGEPLMRHDLLQLVQETKKMGFYSNLITSAIGLTEKKIEQLKNAGLESVQISFQADHKDLNDFIGGKDTFKKKMKMMHAVKQCELPLTLNVVIHRLNIERITEICNLCDSMNPDHVEIASAQYHGWAHKNRMQLIPTPEQVRKAQKDIEKYQQSSTSGVYYVLPDLIEKKAKRCQQGWGHTYICVNPQGNVTPCLSADTLPSIKDSIPNVKSTSLEHIWNDKIFTKYTGLDWMNDEYAKSHPRRQEDWGGCRCQTFMLTGDECAMDPADETSLHHGRFLETLKNEYSHPIELKKMVPRHVNQF